MSKHFEQVKVLEECQISPPPNSAPTATFPITFLDVLWLFCSPIQRIFLYQTSFSVSQFTEEVLPQLKNSLSLALHRFFPFCGNFVLPRQPSDPHILYNDGDSVSLLVACSTGSFDDLLRDGMRDAKELHPLVPPTPATHVSDNTLEELTPLLALQVTLFPNSGLCIGITYRHYVADGMSSIHFMKTWASILQANCDISRVSVKLPALDRGIINDPDGTKDVLLNYWRRWGCPTWKEDTIKTDALMEDKVRATFTLSRLEIDSLKKWVSTKCDKALHFSTFVVTTAFVWVCLIKSLDAITTDDPSKDEEQCRFIIIGDCRNKYNSAIPETYFGNCLNGLGVSVSRSTFRQEDCLATVCEAIRHVVHSLQDIGLNGFERTFQKMEERTARGKGPLTVAGSPKLAVYEIDFGWGRPVKVELVHIDISGSISLSESRNEKAGGIEVGVSRSKRQMEAFTSFFQSGLNKLL